MKGLKLFVIITALLVLFSAALARAQCTIGWDLYTDPNATEIDLYIAATPMGSATAIKIVTLPSTTVQYIIASALLVPGPGAKSYMRITAKGPGGESLPSNEGIYTRPTTSSSSTTSSIPVPAGPQGLKIIPIP